MKTISTPKSLVRHLAFLLVLTMIGSASLSAQEAPPVGKPAAEAAKAKDDALVLSPFTVTSEGDRGYLSKNTISGTGTSESLMKIPQTIQIANQELLQDLASDDPMQGIETVSGSAVRRSFNPGDDTFIWGFRLSSNMKDGIPYTSSAIGTLYDVDRIEVIKGPAAMMFGQNSYTGGVINYVTRKPTKTPKLTARLSIGSYNYRSFVLNASGPLTKSFRYRLDVGTTDSDYNAQKFGRIKNRFIGGGVEYDISAKTKMEADFSYGTSNDVRPKTLIDPITRAVIKMPDDYTTILPWQSYEITQARGKATLTTALSPNLDSRTFVGYNNTTNYWLRDLIGALNQTAHTVAKTAGLFDTTWHQISFGQDFVVRGKTGPFEHKVLFGGDQRNDTRHNFTSSTTISTPNWDYLNPVYDALPTTTPIGSLSEVSISSRSSGAYMQEQLSTWEGRLILLGGFRYNEFFQKSGVLTNFSGTATVSQGSKTISRFGAILQPFKRDITIYFNRSQSFLFNGGVDYRNNPFNPSVGINNEFGVKAAFFNGALSLSATYFDIELTNVRVVFTQGPGDPSPGSSGAKQDGLQTNKGYDLNLGLSKKLGSGTVNVIASCYSGDSQDQNLMKPTAAVNNTWSLTGSYGFNTGALKNFRFGASQIYKGQRFISTGAGYTPAGVPIVLPAYNVTRAFVSYSRGKYSLQFNVDNLFDERYVQGAESAIWVQMDPGRVFKTTLTCRF
ncbi:MAG: TonB-dependent receptor [Opitutus sp.]